MHLLRRKTSRTTLSTSASRTNQPRILIRTLRTRSQTPEKSDSRQTRLEMVDLHSYTPDCLKAHNITPGYRARMIDWMCEITSAFGLSGKTFFVSVKVMDKYFQSQPVCIHSSLLHIIGMISVFIASKFEDIEALTLKAVFERIGYCKFPKEDLLLTEQAILKKLGFLVNFVTRCDMIEELSAKLELNEEVKQLALFFSKLSMYFYEHLAFKESQITLAAIYMAGKVLKDKEVMVKIMQKVADMKISVNFEGFYSDIAGFHKMFPSLKAIFKASRMNFDVVDGVIEIENLS